MDEPPPAPAPAPVVMNPPTVSCTATPASVRVGETSTIRCTGASPDNRDITYNFASDQGAVITVNGGESWTSWYNQPTAQFYHVSTDNAFPYRVCGGQQESGSACVQSRSDDGRITFRE